MLLMRKEFDKGIEKILLGFTSGVMIAASVWSLIMPSIEMAREQNLIAWLPAALGFLIGMFFLIVLDCFTNHLHKDINNNDQNGKKKLSKLAKLILAVTLHNIPEGMAVGVVFAGVLSSNSIVTLTGAFTLSIGIAIQNFPEGAIISMPLMAKGYSKRKAFVIGALSGIVEPIAALFTILLTAFVTPILPYLLSFAAGAMIYVVVEELIPDSHVGENSNLCVIGVALGFVIMMILDVALG